MLKCGGGFQATWQS